MIKRPLPKAVWLFGAVSLLNDAASEMVTPLIPVLVTSVLAASPTVLGFIEGLAEATASVLKYVAGRWVDRGASPKAMILGGYGFSNLLRPVMGLVHAWPLVAALRFGDRIGKGLRTAPRDAWISASVDADQRGRAFGVHRAADHLGAFLGPIAAFALLSIGWDVQQVFVISCIPGFLLILLLGVALSRIGVPEFAKRGPVAPASYSSRLKKLMWALIMVTAGSVPDAFLVLYAQEAGVAVAYIPLLWAAAHLVKAWMVAKVGAWSDTWGRNPVLRMCWLARIAVLMLLMIGNTAEWSVWVLFVVYLAVSGSTESVERAMVGDLARADMKASSFGLFHMSTGLAALPGAVLFGWVWQTYGMATAVVMAALFTLTGTLLLQRLLRS